MEDERVTTSSNNELEQVTNYTKVFNDQFPIYLAMGMSEQEYWWGDNDYPALFKKAFDYKQQMVDEESWLKGAYIYHALLDVAPIYHPFAKRGTKAEPYLETPISYVKQEDYLIEKEKREMEKLKADFKAKMIQINKNIEGGKATNG